MKKKFMIKKLIIFLIIAINFTKVISAQSYTTIKGTIIDESNLNPIPYVNILIENSTIGTITNNDGQFILTFPNKLEKEILIISHLGYNDVRVNISDLIHHDSTFKILPKMIQLKEVEIIEYTPQAILKKAYTNIPKNYGVNPVILTCYLRTIKLVNDKLAEFAEAVIEDYKSGYCLYPKRDHEKKAMSTDIPYLIKGRVIEDTVLLNELTGTRDFAYPVSAYFTDFIELNHDQFFDPDEFRYYTYFMTKMIDQDGNSMYKISFNQKPGTRGLLHKGEVYVDPLDFAIKKIVVTYSSNGYDWYEKHYGRNIYTIMGLAGWKGNVPQMKGTFNYCKKNDRWYFQSKINEWIIDYNHTLPHKNFRYTYHQELVVMDYTQSSDRIASYKGDKQLGVNENWSKIVGQPDEDFWGNFNYLPIEESLKKTIMEMPAGSKKN